MKSHVQVCVIGGGVVGCSVLYHLTKLGWSDVVLLERSELTSGSTWHAAGGFHTLNGDTNMAALQGYTIKLYRELEALTGMSCGLHHVGGVTLADTPERMDMLKAERAKHRYMGLETEVLSPKEIQDIAPVTNVEGVLGGLYDPLDGHLDPAGTTHAYAKGARMNGAEIELHTLVTATNQRVDGSWEIVTDKGVVIAEHLVNAAGAWGLYWIPQRLLLESGMTGGWGTLGQYLISLGVLLPVAIWRVYKGHQIGLRHWLCGLLLGSGAIFYANSFLVTEVIRALVFFYLVRRKGNTRLGDIARYGANRLCSNAIFG